MRERIAGKLRDWFAARAVTAPAPPAATIQTNVQQPAGSLPRHAQKWLYIGLAVVLLAIVSWPTGAPKDRVSPIAPAANLQADLMRSRSEAQRLDEAQRKAHEEARQRELLRQRLAADQGQTLAPLSAQPNAPDALADIKADLIKRRYAARFAPSLAFSYQPKRTQAPTPAYSSTYPLEPPAPARSPAADPVTPKIPSEPKETQPPKDHNALNAATGKDYRLFEGAVIESVLANRLNGSFAGPVNCQVTTNVYSHDGQHILIPQGTRALGEAQRVDSLGQQRLAVFFHRLIMPDGYSVDLDKFQGLNQIGETGLKDKVDNHFRQIFGISLAIGAIAGLAQAGSQSGYSQNFGDSYRQGFGTSLSYSALRILDRFLNILPTVVIREGARVKIWLAGDLDLPDYAAHAMQGNL